MRKLNLIETLMIVWTQWSEMERKLTEKLAENQEKKRSSKEAEQKIAEW